MIRPHWLSRPAGAALVAVMAFAFTTLLAPSPAFGHPDPTIAVKLTGVEPDLPSDVRLNVIDSETSYLALENTTDTPMFALDPNGDPFLQVSTDGAFGDVESPYLAAMAGSVSSAKSVTLDCCRNGRWVRLSDKTSWAWADPRLDPPQLRTPQGTGGRGLASMENDAPLANWEVGLRYGEQAMTARGVLERRKLGFVRTTIDSTPPGVTATVIASRPPQIRVVVRPGKTVTVLGHSGDEFIRVSENGAVARSDAPEYETHRRSIGLSPKTGATWVPMASGGPSKVTWADERLTYSGPEPDEPGTEPVSLGRWQIPVVVNGKPGEISGTLTWEAAPYPALEEQRTEDQSSSGWAPYVVAGALTVALVLAYRLSRRRVTAAAED